MIPTEFVDVPRVGMMHRVSEPVAGRLRTLLGHITQQDHEPFAFPGPYPVSIDKGHFPMLKDQTYHLAEKTDGVRFVFMACMYQDIRVCVLFDRKLTPYIFKLRKCPRALSSGSVFDGEVVADTSTQKIVYSIFDAVALCGVPVFRSPFSTRLTLAEKSLAYYEYTLGDTAGIEIKTFYKTKEEFEQRTPSTRFASDGVVFMPENDPIVLGRHDKLFKLKTHHTIDFSVRGGKLYVYDDKTKRNKVVGVPTGPNAGLAVDGAIVECELDAEASAKKFDKWKVLCVRTDKRSSNTKFVFDKTLLNIRENLTLHEIPM